MLLPHWSARRVGQAPLACVPRAAGLRQRCSPASPAASPPTSTALASRSGGCRPAGRARGKREWPCLATAPLACCARCAFAPWPPSNCAAFDCPAVSSLSQLFISSYCREIVTGEIPNRGTMRNPEVPAECPQVRPGARPRRGQRLRALRCKTRLRRWPDIVACSALPLPQPAHHMLSPHPHPPGTPPHSTPPAPLSLSAGGAGADRQVHPGGPQAAPHGQADCSAAGEERGGHAAAGAGEAGMGALRAAPARPLAACCSLLWQLDLQFARPDRPRALPPRAAAY